MNRTDSQPLAAFATSVPGQQTWDQHVFPLVCQPGKDVRDCSSARRWVAQHAGDLLDASTAHGAVLLRGFPLATAEDFDAVIQALGVNGFEYRDSLSNAVRVNRTARVFSANEAPADVQILFHHEMAQTPVYPGRIFFFCEVPPGEGGATPLCRSDVLYDRLRQQRPQFIRDCENRGLRYTNVMPAEDDPSSGIGRSWRSTLGVDSRDAAEERLRALKYSWEWLDGCLKATTPPLPAVMEITPGRHTFFNQLIAAFCGWKDSRNDPSEAVRHADGTRLDTEAVEEAAAIAEDIAFDVQWQAGDVALLDNTITMHARRPFQGTRKVLASLADRKTQAFNMSGKPCV